MPLPDSPHLGLTRPAGSDPFLRQTFLDDLDILDQYPGGFICTSTSRPTWGAAQAGMQIVEVDTGRTLRWTGTAWAIGENYGRVYTGNNTINTTLAKGASPAAYTIYNALPIARVCTLTVIMTVRVIKSAATPQQITLDPWIDGTTCNFGSVPQLQFPDGPSGTAKQSTQVATLFGVRTGVTVGNHNIQLKATVGNTDDNDITLSWAKAVILLSE